VRDTQGEGAAPRSNELNNNHCCYPLINNFLMKPELQQARILELAEQLEQLVQDMNRARPGSYTTDVLRFYACEIDDIAKALKQAASDDTKS
jgi:hypothetical protein